MKRTDTQEFPFCKPSIFFLEKRDILYTNLYKIRAKIHTSGIT